MSKHNAISIVFLGTIVLLALAAVSLGSAGSSGRSDLVATDTPIGLSSGEAAAAENPEPTASGLPPESGDIPLPSVPNGPTGGSGSGAVADNPGETVQPDGSFLKRLGASAPSVPVSLSIPSLAIDSPIVPVGLESDGTMQIPGATEAGWYEPGRRPGAATGSAVIAAHVDFNDQPGVFVELRRIETGSEVAVIDADGRTRRFVVTERYQLDKDELPVEELFRSGGDPILTLVTCGGAFDPEGRSYSDNIVVRAVPVD